MAERVRDLCRICCKEQRANVIIGAMLAALFGMMALFFLTNDTELQVVSSAAAEENEGCEEMETNPLKLCREEEVCGAVQKYYERLGENTEFAESYDDLIIYQKNGQTKDTYVVFVTYRMKIKDIYTYVPGLGTFFVKKEEDGGIKLDSQVSDTGIQQYIARVTQHEDTKKLFHMVETRYAQAVRSDAMLAESLADLQSAAGTE